MRSLIRIVLGAALASQLCAAVAAAYSPTVAQLDAAARAVGNRRDLAEQIGSVVFSTKWPAEVSQISANLLADHLIVGIRVLGVKFHEPITRAQFADEIVALVQDAFVTVPTAEEVDVWASVPIGVAKGVVVSGDLAKPTSRAVFTVSARRSESAEALHRRVADTGDGIFWDEAWVRTAFKPDV